MTIFTYRKVLGNLGTFEIYENLLNKDFEIKDQEKWEGRRFNFDLRP